MSTNPDNVDPTPTPEPVLVFGLTKDNVVGLGVAGMAFAAAMGWWRPTPDQVVAFGGLLAAVWLVVANIVNVVVRSKVTPVSKARALVAAARAEAPPGKIVLDPPRVVGGEPQYDRPASGPVGMTPPPSP